MWVSGARLPVVTGPDYAPPDRYLWRDAMSVSKVCWSTLLVLAVFSVVNGGAQEDPTPAESLVAMGIVGYADQLSVQPGDIIQFMVSSQLPQYRADIVRLIHGPNPLGPGDQGARDRDTGQPGIPGTSSGAGCWVICHGAKCAAVAIGRELHDHGVG